MASDNHQVDSIRLDGKNYAYWAHLMIFFLEVQTLWQIVSSNIEKPIAMEGNWESNIGKINSWLANFVDPSIGFQLAKFAHPKDAWDYLARLYVQNNLAE